MSTNLLNASAAGLKSYLPVPLDVFAPGRVVPFALYHRSSGDEGVTLAAPAGATVTDALLVQWRSDGRNVLYVNTSEHRLYQEFAKSALDHLMARGDLPIERKSQIYYQTTCELVREACLSSNMEELVGERRENWVNNMVTLICSDDAALDSMLQMVSHDYYTYTHIVNVSVMVTALAYRLGQKEPARLSELASGGLLHDIGKMRIDPNVLNKAGRLTDAEWEEIKNHPSLGLEFLHERPDVKPAELRMVHQHHEKLDGTGYPLGLVGTEISPEAQMTAVVDIYDALTCKRPYREAMSHGRAVEILFNEAGKKINSSMVALWKETIERARKADH